ncbi:MAG: Ig-like domain-containing protein, partial [Bacilli bacterium]|nr:Ig-like domain-containing protein [Bacilli bacterium]
QLNASTTPASPSDKTITWTSSDPRIATVTNTGLVETKGVGTTTITATASNGKSASASIKVEANNTNITGAYTYNETTCPTGREETCQPTTCLVNGTCPAGTAISYKVNDTTTQDFHVLHDDGNTLTVISAIELGEKVKFDDSGNSINGPRTANASLTKATMNWNQAARMITRTEAESVGCIYSVTNSCPPWLYNNTAYWTATGHAEVTSSAWFIQSNGSLGAFDINSLHLPVRAIIDISK